MAPAAAATAGGVGAAGRMPSIEWEPKTLTLDQIKFAREAALYVVSTKTEEEAIRIFTEGLKPVRAAAVRKSSSSFDSSSDDDVDLGGGGGSDDGYSTKQRCGSKGGRRGRRRSSAGVERDVATAPF
ncbi:hypothetical protein U9M48_035239 [Paspalum notatum var. saurae]|uniref:Uncharacterized protein n=1 Tax=Paspalum notatum var. saurae TaxID=547442 RepID=A0AAQ3UCQ8_PASNO